MNVCLIFHIPIVRKLVCVFNKITLLWFQFRYILIVTYLHWSSSLRLRSPSESYPIINSIHFLFWPWRGRGRNRSWIPIGTAITVPIGAIGIMHHSFTLFQLFSPCLRELWGRVVISLWAISGVYEMHVFDYDHFAVIVVGVLVQVLWGMVEWFCFVWCYWCFYFILLFMKLRRWLYGLLFLFCLFGFFLP